MYDKACALGVLGLICLLSVPVYAQSSVFETASIKAAPVDAPTNGLGFMIALGRQAPPHGLLTMTGPLPPLIMFAYNI